MLRTAVTAVIGITLTTTAAVISVPAGAERPAEPPAERPAERPAYEITIFQRGQDVAVVGDTVKLKGDVSPAAPGRTVRLQVKYRGHKRFKNLATSTLSKRSAFTFDTAVDTNRDRIYRVVLPSAPPSTQLSKRVKVRVYQWVPLSRLGSGSGFAEGTASIGGISYPDSITSTTYSGPGDAVFYLPLDGRCRTLQAVAGLTDDSPAQSSEQLDIPPLSLILTPGPAQPVTLDLTGRFDLRISATSATNGVAVLGSPQALCHDSAGFSD